MKNLNKASLILSVLAIIISFLVTVVMLMLGGFAPLIAIASGILLLYYIVLFIILFFTRKLNTPKYVAYTLFVLVLIPILWSLFDPYGISEFLMPNLHLDMK